MSFSMGARIATLAVTVIVCFAAPCAAQAVDSFDRLPDVVKLGIRVFVTDDKGQQTKGKISELSPASLTILHGGYNEPTVFPSDRVIRVSKIDSRLNGFLIGLAAGAVPGILLGMGVSTYCNNESAGPCPVAIPIGAAIFGLAGGGIGYAIDGAINGQTLVFARSVKF
jgi:hypothetical protein